MRLFQSTALRHRDFRLLWIGMLISVSGSMMQNAAILWHIYEITHSPVALGAMGLVRVAPIIVFSLVSGVVADRFNRRNLMLLAQTGMALCAFLLGILARHSIQSAWPIYALAAMSSAFGAFDLPARQAIVPTLVPAEDLTSAFSLNATMFQAASIAGPALTGLVIQSMGIHWAYWLNATSFLAVIAALLAMRARGSVAEKDRARVSLRSVLDGLRFVRGNPLVLSSMLLDFFATFFSSAMSLLPIYARDILKVGATGYGWLYAAAATGAAVSGVCMTFLNTLRKHGRVLIVSVLIYGLATVLFGFSRSFWTAFAALALSGAADTVSMIIRNVIRQLATPDHLRGRMVSVNMIFFMGGPQMGELEAGLVAGAFGAPFSVMSGGLLCMLSVAWVARQWPSLWHYMAGGERTEG
jgi:MFS family permease